MSIRIFRIAVAAIALLSPLAAAAQEAKPARIGFLSAAPPPAPNMAAFRQGMRDRGHIEGATYVLVPVWGKEGGKREETAVLARKLVDRGVDLIVTVGSNRAFHANRAAPSIPIVMASSADPVRAGLIKSLAKPGGNITGMTSAAVDTGVKRLEILMQLARLPSLSDTDMVRIQRTALTDPSAPNPSVEAILHAIIPFTFVDHTHADAVVTMTNSTEGEKRIRELYDDRILIVP